jgi:hypothetical protein
MTISSCNNNLKKKMNINSAGKCGRKSIDPDVKSFDSCSLSCSGKLRSRWAAHIPPWALKSCTHNGGERKEIWMAQ